MKKATISVAVEQEKLRAIQFYMGKSGTSLEAELDDFMARLYKKYVPSQTREYIESMDDPEDRSRPRPNRITKPAGPDAGRGGWSNGRIPISAEVWLDERRWDALEVVLEEQGSNIEQYLQEYLLDLYREMVPPDQVREIESDIQKEALETQREREARKVFSAFRLWENGKSRCLATEYPKDFLDTARLLRKHLLEKAGGADDFARKINGGYDISLSRFEELTLARVDNSGRVAGVFELDFDRQVFSAAHILDGWKSYRFQDVSAAAYQAFRKEHSSQEERWRKFVSRLEGKELTDRDLGAPLKALRDLQPGDLLFTEPANRMGRLLDFQVDCSSDTVQMEVFGPEVKCAKTGSWLDIYVSYDVARQEVRDHLDLTLHRKDGAWEKSFRYDLTPDGTGTSSDRAGDSLSESVWTNPERTLCGTVPAGGL